MHFLRSFQEICKSRDLPSLLPAPSHAGPGFDVRAGRLLGCEGSRQHSLLACVKGKEESSKARQKKRFSCSEVGSLSRQHTAQGDLFPC